MTERPVFLTEDELAFINRESGSVHLWVKGMLAIMRETGCTLTQLYEEEMADPYNNEHKPSYGPARDFLIAHADRFDIVV